MDSEALIDWYLAEKRDLPWRNTHDPYKIWISEVILQQTRVVQGISYYFAFLERFATLKSLAEADLEQVLSLWQGLGYYSRARNLHAAARQIVAIYDGKFPETYLELLKIKGIGEYTAAAIASFAFGEDVAVMDGNVLRVLARFFEVNENILSTKGRKAIKAIALQCLPKGKSATYNQAIMELGALICKPKQPLCYRCPIALGCSARQNSSQDKFPLRKHEVKRKTRFLNYLIFSSSCGLLMKLRKEKDIWEGLYDFFELDSTKIIDSNFVHEFLCQYQVKFDTLLFLARFTHKLTHQDLEISAWYVEVERLPASMVDMEWIAPNELSAKPKPAAISKLIAAIGTDQRIGKKLLLKTK